MIAIPAIDLRDGACVQLVGGRYDRERLRLTDPLEAARGWARAGFTTLHVVDLDAATGRGSNGTPVRAILAEPGIECQAGGGVRDAAGIRALLAAGARRVVVGTRAIEEPTWLEEMAGLFPDRLIVAADVRGRRVATRGWEHTSENDVLDLLNALDPLPLAGVQVTAVHREGRMEGTDMELMSELAGATRLPVYASGGITMIEELHQLAGLGVHAAILGMALYTGALDAGRLAREFAS